MKGHDRRARWKRAVYAHRPRMTDGCRVLLLRLLDDMNVNGVVSVPRSQLAADFGVPPARVSERIKLARQLGYLDMVRRARPKVTAVYQATIPTPPQTPARGTDPVPHQHKSEVRIPVSVRGTDAVPLSKGSEVQIDPTQEVVQAESSSAPHDVDADHNVGSYEKPTTTAGAQRSIVAITAQSCAWCHDNGCPDHEPQDATGPTHGGRGGARDATG